MLTIKRGDTRNAIHVQLTKNNKPIPLNDCRVILRTTLLDGECKIIDAEQGKVAFPVGRLSKIAGYYNYEFIIEYSDGTKEAIPNEGYKKIRVHENLRSD